MTDPFAPYRGFPDWLSPWVGANPHMAWLPDRVLLVTMAGSHAYGMATPSSDLDVRGIATPPADWLFGFLREFAQCQPQVPRHDRDEMVDVEIMDLRKWVSLAADANPNVLELIWQEDDAVLFAHPLIEPLREARASFLSLKARHTFMGYAHSQAGRIRRHWEWLHHPPKAPPTRKEHGLPERTLIPRDQLEAAQALIRRQVEEWEVDWSGLDIGTVAEVQGRITSMFATLSLTRDDQWVGAARSLGFSENFIELLDKEKAYTARQRQWAQYQTWLRERNPARAEMERKYAFDTKHGSHLWRLTKMAEEILLTGRVLVRRPDAEELMAIRNGAWTYEDLMERFAAQEVRVDEAAKASTLPKQPDRTALDALCVGINRALT